jgi:hypothetical protein
VPAYVCVACATQFGPIDAPPDRCPICIDERQFVPASGQSWTTMESLARRHGNQFRQHEPGLIGIGSAPQIAIGQRALLVQTAEGNILWDCITLIDAATIEIVKALGGIRAIAISHPHYYGAMVEWSRAFDAKVYLHRNDRQWVMRPDESIEFWAGEQLALFGGLTLVQVGGHFAGGTVAHWSAGGLGKGALLSGDVVMPLPDRKHVSFMRSYPNLIPLSAPAVRKITARLEAFDFERIYGPFFDRNIPSDAKMAVKRSAERYLKAIVNDHPAELD